MRAARSRRLSICGVRALAALDLIAGIDESRTAVRVRADIDPTGFMIVSAVQSDTLVPVNAAGRTWISRSGHRTASRALKFPSPGNESTAHGGGDVWWYAVLREGVVGDLGECAECVCEEMVVETAVGVLGQVEQLVAVVSATGDRSVDIEEVAG